MHIGMSSASDLKVPGSNLDKDKTIIELEMMQDLQDSKYTPYCLYIFILKTTVSWVYPHEACRARGCESQPDK